jgi:hypothetical protein
MTELEKCLIRVLAKLLDEQEASEAATPKHTPSVATSIYDKPVMLHRDGGKFSSVPVLDEKLGPDSFPGSDF